MANALTAGQTRIMHPVKWSRYVFQCGQRVKTQNLTGQDLDPGRGWEYSRLCSVPPLKHGIAPVETVYNSQCVEAN